MTTTPIIQRNSTATSYICLSIYIRSVFKASGPVKKIHGKFGARKNLGTAMTRKDLTPIEMLSFSAEIFEAW